MVCRQTYIINVGWFRYILSINLVRKWKGKDIKQGKESSRLSRYLSNAKNDCNFKQGMKSHINNKFNTKRKDIQNQREGFYHI